MAHVFAAGVASAVEERGGIITVGGATVGGFTSLSLSDSKVHGVGGAEDSPTACGCGCCGGGGAGGEDRDMAVAAKAPLCCCCCCGSPAGGGEDCISWCIMPIICCHICCWCAAPLSDAGGEVGEGGAGVAPCVAAGKAAEGCAGGVVGSRGGNEEAEAVAPVERESTTPSRTVDATTSVPPCVPAAAR